MATENHDFYIVRPGDTLGTIAAQTGKTRASLIRYNDISNINYMKVGEVLFLNEATAFCIQVLFVDPLRQAIENLSYRIQVDRKILHGKTPANGLSPEFITLHARSLVRVAVKDEYGNWHELVRTMSGYGKKRITLISPYYSFKSRLEPHPPGAPVAPQPPAQTPPEPTGKQPPLPVPPPGEPNKNNPNTRQHNKRGKNGESVIQIGIDLPQALLAYMQAYDGKRISEDGRMPGGTVTKRDIRDNQQDYLRLLNAYRLNPEAALQSASWGKFQIMGDNFKLCGARSIEEFVASMCQNEVGQLKWLAAKEKAGDPRAAG